MNDQYVVEYCHGLIFCSTDCCKCVRCQKGFTDGNIAPVVCYDMFFCSVECCNYYLGLGQHRWAYVPVDVSSLGQIDGSKGKGRGKAMVVGRIVAQIAGAGAGAGKGGIDPKDVRAIDAGEPDPEASSSSCMGIDPDEGRAERRAHRAGYRRIRKAPPERVDSDDSVSSYELLPDHPCEGCRREPWAKVCIFCKRHYCEEDKHWDTMDDKFCNRTSCRKKFDRMIRIPSIQEGLRRERERARQGGSSGSLPPQPPSGPPPLPPYLSEV